MTGTKKKVQILEENGIVPPDRISLVETLVFFIRANLKKTEVVWLKLWSSSEQI